MSLLKQGKNYKYWDSIAVFICSVCAMSGTIGTLVVDDDTCRTLGY